MKVSIGLPVRNGEAFIKATIDSILAQTYSDFELIISDNASTDHTVEICKSYSDPRLRFYQFRKNRGATWNLNRVFRLSKGEYFKWAAHDDFLDFRFLELCVKALDEDSSAVLSFTRVKVVDKEGQNPKNYPGKIKVSSTKNYIRFGELILSSHPCHHIFGLIRSEALRQTQLFGNYVSADRVLLAHLGLLGRFVEIPLSLFFWRRHSGQSIELMKNPYAYSMWFDPKNKQKWIFPKWRLIREYQNVISQTQLKIYERVGCYLFLWLSGIWRSIFLIIDLYRGMKRIIKLM